MILPPMMARKIPLGKLRIFWNSYQVTKGIAKIDANDLTKVVTVTWKSGRIRTLKARCQWTTDRRGRYSLNIIPE